jgi:hypothetical protein
MNSIQPQLDLTRRNFLCASSIAAGAMAFPAILHAQNKKDRIRLGLVGCGGRGTMDSYMSSMDELSLAVGRLTGQFEHAEGWRRHLHLGFSTKDIDPLRAALEADCAIDESYESALLVPR